MIIDIATFSDAGPRRENEDSVVGLASWPQGALLGVADGLGGHFGGSVASRVAVDLVQEAAQTIFANVADALLGKAALERAFNDIHKKLLAEQAENPDWKGMATTATAAIINGSSLIGAHCGDTRCIIQRRSGIKKLTVEHTEARRLFDAGKLTKNEFLNYPRRNVLDRALGAPETPKIDSFEYDVEPGDKILITSDGVHEIVKLQEILELIRGEMSANEIVFAIVNAVRVRGPQDNYSIVAATIS